MQYGERAGLIDLSDWEPSVKPITVEGVPASNVVETTTPMATPIPASVKTPATYPTTFPFIGECGELFTGDLERWIADLTSELCRESQAPYVRNTCTRIHRDLTQTPAKLAALAREQASKNSYGAPVEEAARYIYYRWMAAIEADIKYVVYCICDVLCNSTKHTELEPFNLCFQRFNLFEEALLKQAVVLVKEYGWKGPKSAKAGLGGTTFQRVAIDCKGIKLYGEELESPMSLSSGALWEALHPK